MEIVNDRRRAVVEVRGDKCTVRRYRKSKEGWSFLAVGRENFKKEETAIKQGQKWVDKGEF